MQGDGVDLVYEGLVDGYQVVVGECEDCVQVYGGVQFGYGCYDYFLGGFFGEESGCGQGDVLVGGLFVYFDQDYFVVYWYYVFVFQGCQVEVLVWVVLLDIDVCICLMCWW